MFNVGGGEVLVILLIALIVLGPDKLPNAARQAGKYLGDFRRMSGGFQRELRDAMDLGDLGDLMSGKPTSPGGPTARPAAEPAATTNGATTINGTDPTNGTGPTPADTTEPTTTAPIEATGNGTGPVATAPSPNGTIDGTSGSGTIRKRSIEVDGPSTSFD